MFDQLLPIACLTSIAVGLAIDSSPVVTLDSKLQIRGFVAPKSPSVNQFLGIPYAEPPVDSLRWLPPKSFTGTDAVINATQMPPSCIQGDPLAGSSIYTKDATEFTIDGAGQSEDCLTLSVWAPNSEPPQEGFPVLIWLYGGAFVTGGTDVPYQNPTSWVERSKDLIVVALKCASDPTPP
jgi:carboxylesterase type B